MSTLSELIVKPILVGRILRLQEVRMRSIKRNFLQHKGPGEESVDGKKRPRSKQTEQSVPDASSHAVGTASTLDIRGHMEPCEEITKGGLVTPQNRPLRGPSFVSVSGKHALLAAIDQIDLTAGGTQIGNLLHDEKYTGYLLWQDYRRQTLLHQISTIVIPSQGGVKPRPVVITIQKQRSGNNMTLGCYSSRHAVVMYILWSEEFSSIEIAQALFAKDGRQRTPVFTAVENVNGPVLSEFLRWLSINTVPRDPYSLDKILGLQTNKYGTHTCLTHAAVDYEDNSAQVFKILVLYYSVENLLIQDEKGNTALHSLLEHLPTALLLNSRDCELFTMVNDVIDKCPKALSVKNFRGETPLIVVARAVKNKQEGVADINLAAPEGELVLLKELEEKIKYVCLINSFGVEALYKSGEGTYVTRLLRQCR